MDSVFDSDKLNTCIEQLRENPYHHIICVDDTTEVAAYCLARATIKGDDFTIILCKQMHNRNDFESEVAFLSKCFDATVLRTSFTYTIKSIIDQDNGF